MGSKDLLNSVENNFQVQIVIKALRLPLWIVHYKFKKTAFIIVQVNFLDAILNTQSR